MTTTPQKQETFDLATADGCVGQIISAFNQVQRGYGLADEAMIAYLKIPGKSAVTLWEDLQAAGCPIALKTIRNRQSGFRGAGLLEAGRGGGRKEDQGPNINAEWFKRADAQTRATQGSWSSVVVKLQEMELAALKGSPCPSTDPAWQSDLHEKQGTYLSELLNLIELSEECDAHYGNTNTHTDELLGFAKKLSSNSRVGN